MCASERRDHLQSNKCLLGLVSHDGSQNCLEVLWQNNDLELFMGAHMQNLVKDLWSRMEFLIKSEKEAETVEMFVPAALLIYVL